MAEFYSAAAGQSPPLPWTNLSPPHTRQEGPPGLRDRASSRSRIVAHRTARISDRDSDRAAVSGPPASIQERWTICLNGIGAYPAQNGDFPCLPPRPRALPGGGNLTKFRSMRRASIPPNNSRSQSPANSACGSAAHRTVLNAAVASECRRPQAAPYGQGLRQAVHWGFALRRFGNPDTSSWKWRA